MRDRFTIARARTAEDLRDVARLFKRYAATLPIDLGYQGFNSEVAGLPGKYAAPEGELFLARDAAGGAVGCVGLRPLPAEGECELKRLFILPEARGSGLGRALAEAVVAQARTLRYRRIRLDTLSSMQAALALYRGLGFQSCDAYYAPTPPGTVFLSLEL
ncbi:GNAT family N-acetyltransferase [Kaistia sp. MMO-174]|uniref:GNAT family N-acetyltransferase n=1 Tax=Kaistia sp. MMO-174 TaxID=3081256 RepID=UPI0030165E4C